MSINQKSILFFLFKFIKPPYQMQRMWIFIQDILGWLVLILLRNSSIESLKINN